MIRNQIQAIVATLPGPPTFIFGTPNEVNVKADDAYFANGIVCCYPVQPVETTLGRNGSANNVYSLYLEFLFKTKFENNTGDNEALMNQALNLANRFLVYLRQYKEGNSFYFMWDNNEKARSMPVYNKFDVNTTGVSLTFKVSSLFDPYLLNC